LTSLGRNHFQGGVGVLHYSLQDKMQVCVIGIYMTHDRTQLRIVTAVMNPMFRERKGIYRSTKQP
jgi:hypothetical protein